MQCQFAKINLMVCLKDKKGWKQWVHINAIMDQNWIGMKIISVHGHKGI